MPGKEKSQYINVTTPIGEMKYCYFGKPDQFDKKGCQLILDSKNPEHKAFIEKLQTMNKKLYDEAITKITQKRSEYRMKTLPEPVEDQDGIFIIKARTNATNIVGVYDAQRNPLTEEAKNKVFSGSKGRLNLALKASVLGAPHYKIGYSVYLQAVQVTELAKSTGSSGAAPDAFGAVEGGFVADKMPEGDEQPPSDF